MAKENESVKITRVPLKKIKLSRNSRMDVSAEELEGLMQSIKEVGLLQPIGLVETKDGYEIAYGNRRFLACSKLGLHTIPAIVRSSKRAFDVDIQNLTENIQRRNLGLAEIGRYMKLLEGEGLNRNEIAVRLGVPRSYVTNCFDAFERVPKKFQHDIEVRVSAIDKGQHTKPGKISIKQAQAIINAKKHFRLTDKQSEQLFLEAKKLGPKFLPERIDKYSAAVKMGKTPSEAVEPVKALSFRMIISEKEWERLDGKYFSKDGPINSLSALVRAILAGQIAERIKIIT